jgi:hypothetical protein
MNPSSGSPPPGVLDNLLNFLFGRGQLSQQAGQSQPSGTSGGGIVPSMLQQGNSQIFSDPSQNNTQMQGIVNSYMQQKAAADAATAAKKKKRQPVLAP